MVHRGSSPLCASVMFLTRDSKGEPGIHLL